MDDQLNSVFDLAFHLCSHLLHFGPSVDLSRHFRRPAAVTRVSLIGLFFLFLLAQISNLILPFFALKLLESIDLFDLLFVQPRLVCHCQLLEPFIFCLPDRASLDQPFLLNDPIILLVLNEAQVFVELLKMLYKVFIVGALLKLHIVTVLEVVSELGGHSFRQRLVGDC